MKNQEIKKIQFGGWSKRPFSEIRKKVEVMSMDDDKPVFSLKKNKKCKFNKGIHQFVKHDKDFVRRIYSKYVCINCGKQMWSEPKNGVTSVVVAHVPVKDIE